MAVDATGNLYIADRNNHRIRRVDPSGTITTVAGTSANVFSNFSGDGGLAVQARLRYPESVAVDAAGNLYIAEARQLPHSPGGSLRHHHHRRRDSSCSIHVFYSNYSGDGGPAVQARLYSPADVAVDGAGNLYIADTGNHRIRRVDPTGTITTIAGTGARDRLQRGRGAGGPGSATTLPPA